MGPMCGRFTLTVEDVAALARTWAAEVDEAVRAAWRPRFNIAPGNPHLLLRAAGERRRLEPAVFGLSGPGGKLLINARIETAGERTAFRDAFTARRAAIPADGFLEWEGPPSSRRPSWFHRPDGGPLLLAALFGPAPGGGLAFAILTTAANAAVRPLHDRMPAVVPREQLAAWLGAGPPPPLPAPADDLLVARRLGPRVNAVANDDPACLAPAEPERQGRLF